MSAICGDALTELKKMKGETVNCIVTSPPYYGLRDYSLEPIVWGGGTKSCLGLEENFNLYLAHLLAIFGECKRVLRKDGTMFINIGDSYGGNNSRASNNGRAGYGNQREGVFKVNGVPAKSLLGIPERLAIRLTDELNLIRRNTIIWHKPNCIPSSCKDRFTMDFEYIYFFSKSGKYYFEQQFEPLKQVSIDRAKRGVSENNKWINGAGGQTPHNLAQPRPNIKNFSNPELSAQVRDNHDVHYPKLNPLGRNMRTVWRIPSHPYKEVHFATYPPELVRRCIKAGCPIGGIVLDPFAGSFTTAIACIRLKRNWICIEKELRYCKIGLQRIKNEVNQLRLF